MHLANARQTKIDDATDDEMPSTSGRQFTEATFSDSACSKVSKVRNPNYISRICNYVYSITCSSFSFYHTLSCFINFYQIKKHVVL